MRYVLALLVAVSVGCSKGSPNTSTDAPTSDYSFDLEHLAPAEATVVLSTTTLENISSAAAENAWVRLFTSETAWDLHQWIVRSPMWDGQSDADPVSALKRIRGASVAFLQFHGDPQNVSFALLVEPGQSAQPIDDLWQWFQDRLDDEWEHSTRSIHKTPVQILTGRSTLARFKSSGFEGLVVSQQADQAATVVTGILSRAAGNTSDSVSKLAAFKDSQRSRTKGAVASVFFRFEPVYKLWAQSPSGQKPPTTPLDFDKLTWAAADLVVGRGEYWSLNVRALIPENTIMSRVLRHLRPIQTDLIDALPAETYAFAIASADAPGGLKTIINELDEQDAKTSAALRKGLAEFREEFGLDLVDGVLSKYSGEVAVAMVAVPWSMPDFRRRSPVPAFLNLGLAPLAVARARDKQAVQSVARTIARTEGIQESVRIGSREVVPLAAPSRDMSPACTLAGDDQVFAFSLPALKRTLGRIDGNETLDRKSMNRRRAALGEHAESSLALVIDNRDLANLLVGVLRSASAGSRNDDNRIRWPSAYSIATQLEGQTVAALAFRDRILSLTLASR